MLHSCMTLLTIFGWQESSVIHSNANLGVHGQGFLNLSGPGDVIEAQRLVVSLFYGISVSRMLFTYCKCLFVCEDCKSEGFYLLPFSSS